MTTLACAMAAMALGLAAGLGMSFRDARAALLDAEARLEGERREFAKIVAEASKANLSLAEKIALNDERLNSLDFLVKTGQARK